jgi:PPP family 3-phenylpropionic acid transporter
MGNPAWGVYQSARSIRLDKDMPAYPPLRIGFATRLALLYAAIFALGGVQLPFFPLWLKAKGLDAAMIGLVLAVPMVVRVVAIPFAAREADRRDDLRVALIVAGAASVAGYLLLAFADGAIAILALYTLASLCYTPVMPLTETYALKGLGQRGRAYGPVRLWGSAAFILGTFAAGFAADAMPPRYLIWLIVAGTAVMALATLPLEPLTTPAPAAGALAAPRKALLRDPAFVAVVTAASLIQASHAVYYGFSALAWRGQGLDGSAIAALWALGVIAEIVLFALQSRLPRASTPNALLTVGALGAALRWSMMALDPPVAALPFLQLLHAASFGATHLGALTFIARHAPPGQAASAQGYYAIALGVAMAGATGLSGWLYGAIGTAAYGAMALAAIAGGACGIIAQMTRRIVVP